MSFTFITPEGDTYAKESQVGGDDFARVVPVLLIEAKQPEMESSLDQQGDE